MKIRSAFDDSRDDDVATGSAAHEGDARAKTRSTKRQGEKSWKKQSLRRTRVLRITMRNLTKCW
jgi:hypothetical protein